MALPERLHEILLKLREAFEMDLPDPASLTHSGEFERRGQMYTVRSSAPLETLANEDVYAVYTHSQSPESSESEAEAPEHLRYFYFEGRGQMSAVQIQLDMIEGGLKQLVKVSSLPRELFLQRVEQELGRGAPRQRRPNRFGAGGQGDMRRSRRRQNEPLPFEELSEDMSPL